MSARVRPRRRPSSDLPARARRALAGLTLLGLAACRGPAPVIAQQRLVAGDGDQPLRVEAVVRNLSGGSGQVAVVADVTERASGVLLAREAKEIELDAHGSQAVVLELRLPSRIDGAARDRLELHVAAQYPIE